MLEAMPDDLAFLFADPERAGRSRARRAGFGSAPAVPHPATPPPSDINWVTLREAHEETSIPISTLRKWAKKGKVRGRLTRSEGKDLRLLALSDVVSRAAHLGRPIQPVQADLVVDLRLDEAPAVGLGADAPAEPIVSPPPDEEEPEADQADESPASPAPSSPNGADGSILVPLDAWERMMGQLGNLHEAGQQLADARERAARAETEAEFLKERMREMRKRAEEAELAADLTQQQISLPVGPIVSEKPFQSRWRHWRDSWLR